MLLLGIPNLSECGVTHVQVGQLVLRVSCIRGTHEGHTRDRAVPFLGGHTRDRDFCPYMLVTFCPACPAPVQQVSSVIRKVRDRCGTGDSVPQVGFPVFVTVL